MADQCHIVASPRVRCWTIVAEHDRSVPFGEYRVYAEHDSRQRVPPGPNPFRTWDAALREHARLVEVVR